MVYRSNSSTHLSSSDINNVLPIPTVNNKSSSFTNLTLPAPLPATTTTAAAATTDYDPGKQARRSVRRLSIDIERLRLKKDVTTLCTAKRRNSVCRSAGDLSKSGLYDDLRSLKTQRNECVQKHKSDKIAVPCTTTSKTSVPPANERLVDDGVAKFPAWLSEGLEPDPELEDKNLNRVHVSVPLNRLQGKTVDLLLAIKNNQTMEKLKILCLYCDRTFSSQTLYAKHSERVHQAPEGRRLSARKTNSSSLLYPGCSHCHNGKTTSLLNEELPALFHHLIDIHFDKYFACKPCTVRFPSREALQTHLDQLHKGTSLKASPDKRKKRIDRRVPDNVPANLSQPLTIQVDLDESFDDKKDDDKSSSDEPILRSSRRQNANRSDSTKATNSRKTRMLRNEETILSRLGITQNRSPRTRRGLKTRAEVIRAETPIIRPTRNKNTRSTNNSSGVMIEGIEMATRSSAVTKVESLSSTFDENFYESVSSNVRQNLSRHLDGKIQSGPMSPSPISPVDPVPTVRSTLVKSPLVADSEIHEATAISALTAFPTLLTASQYGAEPMPVGKIKKPITKNSWKWKWDCVKKYKYVNEGGKIVKKVKQPVAGIRDLSKLDMWTQLTMRTKHELVRKHEWEVSGEESCLAVGEAAREDKRKLITQLNKILDTRILPQINLEQNDQRVVKLEKEETNAETDQIETKADVEQPNDDLLAILQIAKKPVPTTSTNDGERVLSGEWARPRCYICCGCGEKFENIRRLEDHKNTSHPHVYSTHYEIVGKELIEGDLFRHFYIPSTALRGHSERLNMDRKGNVEVEDSMDSLTSFSNSCSKSDSFDMDSNSRNSKVSAISMNTSVGNVDEMTSSINDASSAEHKKSCTKCNRSYNTMSELYRHMLDCSGDYDWFLAKKRHNIKYRYFGSRRRKINRTNFGNRRPIRPKKEESDTPRIRDVQTPKPRPSDAESIQRMLANLPAKRVCRQIFPNLPAKKRARKFMPVNTLARSRQQMHLKPTNAKTNRNFKFIATTQTAVNAIRKNISRRMRFFAANNANDMVRSTRSARTPLTTKQQPNDEETTEVAAKSRGVVKNITRRTQRLFPKLANQFRRPLQKRNLRNAASAKMEANSGSIMDRMRKSKRVQVTLKKLDENVADLVKLDDTNIAAEQQATEGVCSKGPVKKTIKRLIKTIRGKRAGSKKTIESNETETVAETPFTEVKVEEAEVQHVDEVKDLPTQIDETSQSSSRSGSSRKSKRNSVNKQKSIESIAAEVKVDELVIEVTPSVDNTKIEESMDIQQAVPASDTLPDEPMDLSQSKTKLSVPVVQDPIKTPPMKRRTRKLNDCIAMLTGKLQEKLGVPFINSETNILLSPTKSDSAETPQADVVGDGQVQDDEAKTIQKSSKEPSSNHSTPTKRGSRSPKTKQTKSNVVSVEPVSEMVNDLETSKLVSEEEAPQIISSVTEVTPTAAEIPITSLDDTPSIVETPAIGVEEAVTVPEEVADVIAPTILEDVEPVKTTPKRSASSQSKKSDKSVTKRQEKVKSINPLEEPLAEGIKPDSAVSEEVVAPPNATTDTSAKTGKKKDTKKKNLQEATITIDVAEPPVMEDSSLDTSVSKKRQTKNSSLKSLESSTDDKTSVTAVDIVDSVEETNIIPVETITSKPKPAKGRSPKNNSKHLDNAIEVVDAKPTRRNSPKVTSSPQKVDTQETDEKPAEKDTVKDVKKSKKSKKKAVVNTDTELPKVVTPNPLIDNSTSDKADFSEDEMHPWDPERGFIINAVEPPNTPANEPSPPVPDTNEKIEKPSSSCNETTNEIVTPPATSVTGDDKLTTKKKRRKNELAKIIADQLLESFKEVDKSRIEELKLLHDLSIESKDDLLLSTTMSRTPPPKRRTASSIRNDVVAELSASKEEVNGNENVDKVTSKRKKAIDLKKSLPIMRIGKKKKTAPPKSSKKDNKKKVSDVSSSGYLSDTEVCQQKKPTITRRRLTICDESPKRMSRNSKETEVPVSLFDSFKKRKNINDIPKSKEPKPKPPTKVVKRKNKRNLLHPVSNDSTRDTTNDAEPEKIDIPNPTTSDKCEEDNANPQANVNDLVTQIINDFTTSSLNSPTTSPILFGDLAKSRLNNAAATKLSSVLSNKKNILNGESLTNGFKSDVSKEITFATLSQPLKDKSVEQIRNSDSSTSDGKPPPFRAPFMSPRWDPSDEWNGASKPIKDPALHKLWTLNNKDEQLTGEKSLYQSVKEKTKKFLGKISRKKMRKHDGTLNNKKAVATVFGTKRPLLRPSILSVSNHTTNVCDTVETENCLKKLESNSLFLGKISNFENDSISKIFRNDKINSTASDRVECAEIATENELFSKKTDIDATIKSNLKSSFEKEEWKLGKKFDDNTAKRKIGKNDCNLAVEAATNPKRNVKRKQKNVPEKETNEVNVPVGDAPKEDNVEAIAKSSSTTKRRKMGSTKRKTDNAVSMKKVTDDLNKAFCSKSDSSIKPAANIVKSAVKTNTLQPFDESSQDTIISEIVNKIRDSNNDQVTTESDEDLSLAEIAKSLNNKLNNAVDELSNHADDAAVVEVSESFIKSDFSTLVAAVNDQLDGKNDEKTVDASNCDEDADDGEFMNDTNTDLIDMDLEDSASVYTSSMETTVTTSGGSQKRRKRRSILMKPSRKSKRVDGSFLTPEGAFFCDLCSKTFRTQGGLATHRTTLTHISKLSEQEFKQKMETPKEIEPETSKPLVEEDVTTKPDVTKSPVIESSAQPQVPFSQSPSSNLRHSAMTSPVRNQSLTYLNNIEPISSPEHHDFNYDRYSTGSRPRNNAGIHDSSRIALSQEQRFFYECCSMLKGSDRSNVNPSSSPNKYYTLPERSEVITKPVTPRSNEQYSYVVPEGSKHSKGIPKIDLNQFSDISSDSNPAFSCPQNPSSSETQNIFPIEAKRVTEKGDYHSTSARDFDSIKKDARTFDERTTTVETEYMETFSDMGDSFPSSQDVSESEQYTQTILERSSNSVGLIRGGYHDSSSTMYGKSADDNTTKRRNVFTIAMENSEAKGFSNSSPVESPLHSTSSQSSTLSKPRTKAAMKGYDNFKISIPTTGIDLQQALNRSPNAGGCKLAALADIALGNDVPNVAALMRSHSDPCDVEPSRAHTPLKESMEEPVREEIPTQHKQQMTKKTSKVVSVNNRKKKVLSPKTPKKSAKGNVKISPKSTPKSQPKDVYDFEDFEDSTDAPILTLSQVRSKPVPPAIVDDVCDSETSSYSDRLDFNYESMSESDTSVDNLQKKCLIERIFKSVKKTDAKEKIERIEPKKPLPKQELDKLFDGLRQTEKNVKVEEKKVTEKKGSNSANTANKQPTDVKCRSERSRDRQSKKPREIANLEEEWGMSMNQIVELIGVGQRKTQRRCAANKQKTFAENWSSDEYEDFHATKDIFALIREAEMKAGRARSRTARSNAKRERQQENDKKTEEEPEEATGNVVKPKSGANNKADAKDKENKATTGEKNDDSKEVYAEEANTKKAEPSRRSHSKSTDSKNSVKKPAKVKRSKSFVATESDSDDEFDVKKPSTKPPKIKNRRQTISSRHDLHKMSSAKAVTNGARVKQNRSIDSSDLKAEGKMKNKPMSRRKRKASEMLYYWSSSSDEEFGRIKPRDDNFDDDNLEQHGWIVGDSHKKLVTLLAHAKGKKIEDCAVKKAIHKKKS